MCDQECVGLEGLPPELMSDTDADTTGFPHPAGRVAPAVASVSSIAQGEAELIRRAIATTHGNLTRAARELDIAKSTLYQKVKLYGLEGEIYRMRGS